MNQEICYPLHEPDTLYQQSRQPPIIALNKKNTLTHKNVSQL